MTTFIVRRLFYSVITLLLLGTMIFSLVQFTGDPATVIAGGEATPEELDRIREDFGLNRPILEQYTSFIGDVAQGDLGRSFNFRAPVRDLYFERLPRSLTLAGAAFALSIVIGIPAGIISAVKPGGWRDWLAKLVGLAGMSIPNFVVGLTLMYVLAVRLRWLPTSGPGGWDHLVMPSFALGWYFAASMMRLVRSSMLDVLGGEYVKLARLKGVPEQLVVVKHAFKNALIPVLTLAGVNFAIMVNAAVVIESVFNWPGIGELLKVGITQRDFPLVQGVTIMAGVMVIGINFIVDVLYAWLDPRIRLTR